MSMTDIIATLQYAIIALLTLSMLVALLALVLQTLAFVFQRMAGRLLTARAWLALAWLASLLAPALAGCVFYFLYQFALQVPFFERSYALSDALHDGRLVLSVLLVFLITLLLTMVGLAWLTGRQVLHPLKAMGLAARQIASGSLEIRLPEPQVREVAEVAAAFTAMSEALQASINQQARLEQERRFFIGAAAHDLRTPLFSLRGYLEGLERGLADTPEKAARYIAVCRQQADALERLVADLFAYTRLEYLEQTPEYTPQELGELLHAALDSANVRAEAKRITLVAQPSHVEVCIRADRHLLTRAVENLLDNALRYTPEGGAIHVHWGQDSHHGWFSVSDNGPGFAPSDLPHIFAPMYRGESSRSRQTGGAGLGLAIARRILEAHGGDLTATNGRLGGAVVKGYVVR
jgi:signal transduction histidine kinase